MATTFPGLGRRYLVDFVAFKVELYFSAPTSLTYTGIAPDGTRGGSETVVIRTEEIGTSLFLVTWQEGDKTTVVHIEDYNEDTIITNITSPNGAFDQFHGSFVQVPPLFGRDIRPLFRPGDISCMAPKAVRLDDAAWMCNISHATKVYNKLASGDMPPDGAWSPPFVALFKQWLDAGCQP